MPGADEQADERYKAQLRREEQNWDARFKYVLHSDLAAVQVGITALRTAILINAGASVALLAFAAQLWEKDKILIGKMLGAGGPFVWGLVISALASGIAYFYQSFITRKYHQELEEISANRDKFKPARWLPAAIGVTRVGMIMLVLCGYALFVRGAFSVTCAIQPTGMGCGPWW